MDTEYCLFKTARGTHMVPGSSVHGIFQARVLVWVAIPFSRGNLPDPGIELDVLHCRQMLYHLSHQGSPLIRQMEL